MNDAVGAPIGIFDSGVGGLTVVLELFQQMPLQPFIYYADTAHVPYGPRDARELKSFAHAITEFLVEQGCKMIIIACNTSTSLAYEELSARFPVPVIGVIEPGVDKALETTKNNRVGVIGTQATINSGAYNRMLKKKDPQTEVFAVPCPRFVPLIEQGKTEGEEISSAAQEYLAPLKEAGIDTIILGCTHYPFLLPVLSRVLGPSITAVDPARETISRARQHLRTLNLLEEDGMPRNIYFASGDPEAFRQMGSLFLGRDLGAVKGVKL